MEKLFRKLHKQRLSKVGQGNSERGVIQNKTNGITLFSDKNTTVHRASPYNNLYNEFSWHCASLCTVANVLTTPSN